MSDGETVTSKGSLVEETPQEQEAPQAVGGMLSRWIAAHPRRVLWFIVLAFIPYILLCWGATFVVLGALLTSGGCGG